MLLLQLHLTTDLLFCTVELYFTVTLGQAKLLPVAISALHVVCTVIILIMAFISNYTIFCFFNSVNQNCGSVGPEKQQN